MAVVIVVREPGPGLRSARLPQTGAIAVVATSITAAAHANAFCLRCHGG